MFDDFLICVVIVGLGFVLVMGMLGSFVVWWCMVYFGDLILYVVILGVVFSFVFVMLFYLGMLVVVVGMVLLVVWLIGCGQGMDIVLGVIVYLVLVMGLVVVSFIFSLCVSLDSFLFGDIFVVMCVDLLWIWGGGLLVLGLLVWCW